MKHIKTVKESYQPSSESYRKDVEAQRNKKRMDMYKDKQVCKEYEHWLDHGRQS